MQTSCNEAGEKGSVPEAYTRMEVCEHVKRFSESVIYPLRTQGPATAFGSHLTSLGMTELWVRSETVAG